MSGCCFGSWLVKGRKAHAHTQAHAHAHQDANVSLRRDIKLFSYKELRSATNSFHASSKIGRGGFGTVYKGILNDGTEVAVKALSAGSRQGVNEFLSEIQTITNVKHPNLVELLGCCIQENNRILVYEYVENNSLDHALFGSMSKIIELNWSRRSAICIGTARGLAFLHEELEPHIVHRDIKSSNILLGKDFVPKIGDFGMAKLFPDNITHISTRIAGTFGYLAPEYARHGQLTKKADVYSFGVLVLEIVSGRSSGKANWGKTQKFLLEWTWELYDRGQLLELVDPEVGEYSEEEVLRYIKVALFCTQAAAGRRPTMTQVVDMLSRPIRLNEKELTPPGFFQESERLNDSLPSSSNKASINSTTQLLSSPVIITEVDPR
ncbi:putative serine/threonine-protein kinase [Macadamia integrifolia]|uniref:putative serine/threonine-protein kinase n=1 Tax=Macadamia integrifolia TaxID=60698 RepID=UPI001C527B93|nr:putative serine/threonine-protein kinase [Macadamia integrifolia]